MTRRAALLRRVVCGSLLAVLALSLWGVAPASADGNAAIDHASPTQGAVRLLVSVPGTDPVDLTKVSVTIAGRAVQSQAAPASTSSAVTRTSVLAIDTSQSMAGTRIAEAKKAALAYLTTVPANVRVGVVTFDDKVKVLVPPGLDRAGPRTAINALKLRLHTALYAGMLGALQATGTSGADTGQRKILLLSDGKDTTGDSLTRVLDAIKRAGASVDVVSLQHGTRVNQPLADIAAAGKGTILAAQDPAVLTAAFAKEAVSLARQVLVTAQLPPGFSKSSTNVSVKLPTSSTTFTAAAYVSVQSAAGIQASKAVLAGPHPVTAGAFDLSRNVMYGAVGAMALGVLGLLALFGTANRKPTNLTLAAQISAYGVMSVPGQPGPRLDPDANAFSGQARQMAERALANNKDLEARVAHRLEAAGMSLRPAEWLMLRSAIAVVGGLVGVLFGTGNLVLGIICVAAAFFGPPLYLRMKRGKRLSAFSQGLADTLQLMAGSLSAGLSLAQSIDTIVREGAEPISSEFRRVVIETRLGVTLEDSLEGVSERMESRDFQWVVMAIRIQREVGGNLAELLLTVAATLREREYLRRHVKALSAEGRLSCYVLGGLPPGFLVYLTATKPDYVHPLYTTPIGWMLCGAMALLLSVGMFWMFKVAKVDL